MLLPDLFNRWFEKLFPERVRVVEIDRDEKDVGAALRAVLNPFAAEWGQDQRLDPSTAVDVYRKVVWVYASVYAIATTIAQIPLRVRRKLGNGKLIDLPDTHPLVRRLENPNLQGQSTTALVEDIAAWLQISGNSWVALTLASAGAGGGWSQLWTIPSNRVKAYPTDGGKTGPMLVGKIGVEKEGGGEEIFTEGEFIHFREFGPDPVLGMGFVEPAIQSAVAHLWASKYNRAFFKNGARPDILLSTGVDHDATGEANLRNSWNADLQGAKNAGRTKVIWGDAKVHLLSSTAKDLDFPKLLAAMREEILGASGAPPFKVGVLDHANFANSREQRHEFFTGTCRPKMTRIAETFTRAARIAYEDDLLVVEFDTAGIEGFHEDRKELHERVRADYQAGTITLNQFLEETDREALGPPGDVYLQGGRLVRVEEFGSVVPPAPPPAAPVVVGDDEDGSSDSGDDSGAAERHSPRLVVLGRTALGKFDEGQRVALWKQFEAAVIPPEKELADAFVELVQGQVLQALAGFQEVGFTVNSIPNVLEFFSDPTQITEEASAFAPILGDLNLEGARHANRQIAGLVRRQLADPFAIIDEEARAWAARHSAELVTQTNATTKALIRKEILQGIDAGLSESEIALNISQRVGSLGVEITQSEFLGARSLTIARTETTGAFNNGSLLGYETNDAVAQKEWLSSRDDRVRSPRGEPASPIEHRRPLDGQRKALNEPFEVPNIGKGANPILLKYPGEYSLGHPGAATINCRCTMIPVVETGFSE